MRNSPPHSINSSTSIVQYNAMNTSIPEKSKGTERTINAIWYRDRNRLLSVTKGLISNNYIWTSKLPWQVRQQWAIDIFDKSISVLLEKYPLIVETNYQSSEKLLYSIIRNEFRRFVLKNTIERAKMNGTIIPFMAKYNEEQRKRNRKEHSKKCAIKAYYIQKNDPVKHAEYLKKRLIYQRQYRLEKKLGIWKDKRKFDPENPYKLMKFSRRQK